MNGKDFEAVLAQRTFAQRHDREMVKELYNRYLRKMVAHLDSLWIRNCTISATDLRHLANVLPLCKRLHKRNRGITFYGVHLDEAEDDAKSAAAMNELVTVAIKLVVDVRIERDTLET